MNRPQRSTLETDHTTVDSGVATISWIEAESLALDHIDPAVDRPLFRIALAGLIAQGEVRLSKVVEPDEPLAVSVLELMLGQAHMSLALTTEDRSEASSSVTASTSYCTSVVDRVTTKEVSGLSVTLLPGVIAILGEGQKAGFFGPEDQGSLLLLATAELLDSSLENQYVERLLAIEKVTEAKLLLLTVDGIDDGRDRRLVLSETKRWCQEGVVLASGAFDSYVTEEAEAVIAAIDELMS